MHRIWVYWENVYSDSMPDYISLCLASLKIHAGSSEVIVLNPGNVHSYVPSLRSYFEDIPEVAHKADYVRAAVLAEHGGMWLDIDALAFKPLSLITGLLPLTGAVFYGWRPKEPSLGMIASVPGHPLLVAWLQKIEAALESSLSQRWAGIGYDLLWPLAKEIPYTQVSRKLCAPTHYTETEKFLEPGKLELVVFEETVIMQLYNKMFFRKYGRISREEILGSSNLLADCFAKALTLDERWSHVERLLASDESWLLRAEERARNSALDVGTEYVKLANELYSNSV